MEAKIKYIFTRFLVIKRGRMFVLTHKFEKKKPIHGCPFFVPLISSLFLWYETKCLKV